MSVCPSPLLEHQPKPAADQAAERGLITHSRCFGCGAWLHYTHGVNQGGYRWSRWVPDETSEATV